MNKYLEKLRNKSESDKKQIVQTSAITTTLLIVIIWLILTSLITHTSTNPNKSTSFLNGFNTLMENGLSSFDTIEEKFKEKPLDEFMQEIDETGNETESITETDNYGTE